MLVERSVRTCVHVHTHTHTHIHTHTHTGIGSRNIASALLGSIDKRAKAVVTKYHKLGGLSNRNSFSHAKKKKKKKKIYRFKMESFKPKRTNQDFIAISTFPKNVTFK